MSYTNYRLLWCLKKNRRKEERKEEGIFPVVLKSKYRKKGESGQVLHIGKKFVMLQLKTGKTVTRQPQKLGQAQ